MLFSKTSAYGIRAVLYLSMQKGHPFVLIREIAENLNLSYHFLGKIFQNLSQGGLITSYKGPNGGVRLARKPEDIFVLDVVRVLEGMDLFTECVFGLDKCSDHFPCPLHHKWFRIRKEISEMMAST
ncbi:MAG TPA: Rrf2 family transcriptional regulator, partial [Bacteroidetes bacterium]|nr:Rrf2 family transcriptional regulator [Bacteroidota bacterium]